MTEGRHAPLLAGLILGVVLLAGGVRAEFVVQDPVDAASSGTVEAAVPASAVEQTVEPRTRGLGIDRGGGNRRAGGGPAAVIGVWRTKGPMVDQGLRRVYLTMEVFADQVVFRPDCRYLDGSILRGTFTTRAEVTSRAIRILEAGGDKVEAGQNSCVVSITPMVLDYVLKGETVTMSFDRRRVDFARQ